jgi:hypothetical protein
MVLKLCSVAMNTLVVDFAISQTKTAEKPRETVLFGLCWPSQLTCRVRLSPATALLVNAKACWRLMRGDAVFCCSKRSCSNACSSATVRKSHLLPCFASILLAALLLQLALNRFGEH